ncbi:3-oxoacyl-[acyl-carrier-protein] reductase [Clostridia bacterium OttesenSCG-928-O13]|nr:3-oxoacyl-[acyl-carrier-protein] reductase [Clostridia bacterium OttesenSCG-928-O13]
MNFLQDKMAIVTGASRGLGRAIAIAFAKAGANLAAVYAANRVAAEQAAEEMRGFGGVVRLYQCDVASFDETRDLAEAVLQDFGKVDILVNNAGIVRDKLLLNMEEDDFDTVIATNLKGAYNMVRHLYRPFASQGSGRILNITSVAGLSGNVGQANYAASKAGLIGFTKTVAKELAAKGVTCNAIAPGFIRSDMTAALPEKVVDRILATVPAKAMGTPEDVASLAAFLASDAAGYITGEVIRVDGGMCM